MKKYFLMAALFVLALASCKNHSEEEHHHDAMLKLSAYSSVYELYVVASPFVKGEEGHVAAHITTLSDYKPLAAGSVHLILNVGGSSVSLDASKPAEPGIFTFHAKPEATGRGTLTIEVKGAPGMSRFSFPVQVFDDEHAAHEAAEAAEIKSGNAVVFSKEKSWKSEFSVARAEFRPVGTVIKTVARIEPSQGDESVISAKGAGTVSFVNQALTQGSAVSAGQALFRIDTRGMVEGNLSRMNSEMQSEYDRARREYDRKKELRAEKLITESDLLKAKNEYEVAAARIKSLRGSSSGSMQIATSPISGYVQSVDVANGEFVEPGRVLARVARNRDLYMTAEVPSRYYPVLHDISLQSTVVRPMHGDVDYTLSELGGRIVSYGKSVSAENHLLPVIFCIHDNGSFVPGSFVNIHISTTGSRKALCVPDDAVLEQMGSYFVYVQLTPELFEKRQVKIGESDGRYVEIRSGLKSGERVVAKGAVLVKLAQSAGSVDAHAGHVH